MTNGDLHRLRIHERAALLRDIIRQLIALGDAGYSTSSWQMEDEELLRRHGHLFRLEGIQCVVDHCYNELTAQ